MSVEKAKCTYLNFEPKDPDVSYEGKHVIVMLLVECRRCFVHVVFTKLNNSYNEEHLQLLVWSCNNWFGTMLCDWYNIVICL